MEIAGEWWVCDDGVTRPTIQAKVAGTDGVLHSVRLLVDTGADRTAFSAALLAILGWTTNHKDSGYALKGIGGSTGFVEGTAVVELTATSGAPVRINGSFCAFTDPGAADLSILGRDVLHHFDVIVSRRRSEVLLLAGNHRYHITA